jgi:hypothetical protein
MQVGFGRLPNRKPLSLAVQLEVSPANRPVLYLAYEAAWGVVAPTSCAHWKTSRVDNFGYDEQRLWADC